MEPENRTRVTERLRLEPVGPALVEDLWLLHQDAGIARWYGGTWTREEARERAVNMGRTWESGGVHKWLAYDRESGGLVGRGGLSCKEVDGARRLEVGWAVRERLWGHGYASEIGRASLALAFEDLGADEVVAFTEVDNLRSRAVMERLGFTRPRRIRHRGEPFVLYVLNRPTAR
ncbi:RimJ/RimL family protein N-acetyltransferase [Nocardiopsis sp. Huas11]|uniref:GNAT family N-acetyltransferase n=1 Tax=Nocardiopsis sp. Huas11 TaxID=2183912 RepID=UPI000EB50F0D|nr:GNAT family N-acetyltransferase [Nocardiopsis sp. Huas11]RKS09375.1 RimJ/RimL family protein N-acetyltransferase [Nocardiopsis sp. Huas11]